MSRASAAVEEWNEHIRHSSPGEQPQRDSAAYQAMLEKARSAPMKTIDMNDDQATIERVKHTMLPGESLGAWYSRIGLGKSQIHTMTRDEILAFALVREAANAIDPETKMQPRILPQKFSIMA